VTHVFRTASHGSATVDADVGGGGEGSDSDGGGGDGEAFDEHSRKANESVVVQEETGLLQSSTMQYVPAGKEPRSKRQRYVSVSLISHCPLMYWKPVSLAYRLQLSPLARYAETQSFDCNCTSK